eukprot:Lithocolla_globosa_v1_NODE_262_length_4766_cov_108.495648.p7 type:complete len:100 gc:universal NODE_262_length_4766_cov_108.495648:1901-1602(-)
MLRAFLPFVHLNVIILFLLCARFYQNDFPLRNIVISNMLQPVHPGVTPGIIQTVFNRLTVIAPELIYGHERNNLLGCLLPLSPTLSNKTDYVVVLLKSR